MDVVVGIICLLVILKEKDLFMQKSILDSWCC